jgi:hypothetical protein
MDSLNRQDLQMHITILGWIQVVSGALLLVVGGFVLLLLSGIGFASGDPTAMAILSVVGTSVGFLMLLLALPSLLAGYGLLKGKSWGRFLAIVVGILGIFNFPVGTLIGAYTLWVLLQDDAAAIFIVTKTA